MQKHANLLDLVKSFPTNIYLQNLAWRGYLGFLSFLRRTERTCLLACFDTAENELLKVRSIIQPWDLTFTVRRPGRRCPPWRGLARQAAPFCETFGEILTKNCDYRAVQRSALCRSRRELSNAYFLAKFGFDTADNEHLTRTI